MSAPDAALTLPELAALIDAFPRPKLCELHCHPLVVTWLRLATPEAEPQFPWTGALGSLTGIPVIKKPDMEPGAWEIHEDGEVVASGQFGLTS